MSKNVAYVLNGSSLICAFLCFSSVMHNNKFYFLEDILPGSYVEINLGTRVFQRLL